MSTTNDQAIARTWADRPGAENSGEETVGSTVYRPSLDMYALADRYEIHVDLPGTTKDRISVTVDDGVLAIEASVDTRGPDGLAPFHTEYGVGDFRRQIRLGEDIDIEHLSAKYEDGVLTLVLPKLPERQPRRVEVMNG